MNNTEKDSVVVERRKSSTSEIILIVLMVLVLSISVGYALLSSTLNISGTSTVADSKWEIDGGDIECPEGQVCTINPSDPDNTDPDDGKPVCSESDPTNCTTPNGAVIWMDGDTIYFKHVLVKPGDSFTFYATIKNNGNLDAKVSNVTKNELNTTARKFLDYTVTDADGNEIVKDRALNAGDSLKVKVTVAYKTSITTLPTSEELALINEVSEGHVGATSFFSVSFAQAD